MGPSPQAGNSLTSAQQQAVAARGNVLVMAGAGTGKTHTLVERCLDCVLNGRASLDEILVVTFTEAAATEMRRRLRVALETILNSQLLGAPKQSEGGSTPNQFCSEQLALFDTAHIGTLHGFCLKLVRGHFYELGLDPQMAVLDEGGARLLAGETLDAALQNCYAGQDELSIAVRNLIRIYGGGRDENIRALVLRLHDYSQTRPDAAGWLAGQIESFSAAEPGQWRKWFDTAASDWRREWMPPLENLRAENVKAGECLEILQKFRPPDLFRKILAADGRENFPKGRLGKLRAPLADFFNEASFLNSLAATTENDPLAEDWSWTRGHLAALLRLVQEFERRFSERKCADGVLDFHDLEQFALKLLWNFKTGAPTEIARRWREKLRFVFVDEYQDINAAQDKIIQALSRDGADANRFLVGDVKQSIYRFRLADPKIFRDYAKSWRGKSGETIPLSENFRSREPLLDFVNSFFGLLLRAEVGGVEYNDEAKLKFGRRRGGTPGKPDRQPTAAREDTRPAQDEPRVELLLRLKNGRNEVSDEAEAGLADLEESDKEARLLALRLRELKNSGHEIRDDEAKVFRPADWHDMAVLLRSPAGKSEIFARQFERAGVPLVVARGGFFDSAEIQDLLSLLQLLDNPLQDVPVIAVLRSPFASCSLDELAEIRLAAKGVHFWTALNRVHRSQSAVHGQATAKASIFLERFLRWRKLARLASLSECLEQILEETHYADWLQAQPRHRRSGRANVEQFLNLAQQFDRFHRQGLFRFLNFIKAQREAGAEPEVAAAPEENAVRLMSIHQSKGLEFPVVALADLAKQFNTQDLRGDIILNDEFGLCPRVRPPGGGGRYPSLTHWLAQRRQRRELLGEELRLLYVAMTRARDTLILSTSIAEKNWDERWTKPQVISSQTIAGVKNCADWLGLWFGTRSAGCGVRNETQGALPELRWRIVVDAEISAPGGGSRGDEAQIKIGNEMEPPHAGCHEKIEKLRERLEWDYPFKAATERPAKSSVTALRREADEPDDEAEPIFPVWPKGGKRKAESGKQKLSAAETGVAHHKFLQHFSLEAAAGLKSLEAEAKRLASAKILSAAEHAALELEAVAAFWNSAIGEKIRDREKFIRRELPFTARFSPEELAEILEREPQTGFDGEFVVVQGVADLAVLLPKEIWLVDFKTDAVRPAELREKTKTYEPQLKLYAAALGKIYSRAATHCWLHFLASRRTVEI